MKPSKKLSHKPGANPRSDTPDKVITLSVPSPGPDDEAPTLLPFLLSALTDLKRTTVKELLRHGQIKVNNTITTRFDYPLKPSDAVHINRTRQWQTFSNPRVKIYYEDDDIIVAYKGYGLLSVGTDTKKEGTAYSILRDYVKRVDPRSKLFIVHRLDQHTSGLMMFAKTIQAKEAMQHNWNNMVLERKYLAIVEGKPEEENGTIRNYLAENARHLMYVTSESDPDAQLAVTHWKALRSRGPYTLMEVSLDTGRKNQIRVHMSGMGHPIAGDRRYGAKTSPIHRLALHAATLRFVHPTTRRDMIFTAPAPAAFDKLVSTR